MYGSNACYVTDVSIYWKLQNPPPPSPTRINRVFKLRPRRPFLLSLSLAKVSSLPLNITIFKYKTLVFRWKDLTPLPVKVQIFHPSQARFNFPTPRARTTV